MSTLRPTDFTGRPEWRYPGEQAAVAARRILISGAGGSIGGALSERLSRLDPERLVLLDRCEHNLFELQRRLGHSPATELVLGDAGDVGLMDDLLRAERPDVIIHAAAHKHAPLLESQPLEALRNNFLVTSSLLDCAARHGVGRFVLLGTDKAVEPAGVMGLSKRLAELALLVAPAPPAGVAVRLGNVWGSRGSVLPLFEAQLVAGEQLTVTHRDASRFFLAEAEAVSVILAAADAAFPPGILVPRMGEPVRIQAIARRLLERCGIEDPDLRIVFTGLRPGDKLSERLVGADEVVTPAAAAGLFHVEPPAMDRDATAALLGDIAAAVRRRDLGAVVDLARRLQPPGSQVREQPGIPE